MDSDSADGALALHSNKHPTPRMGMGRVEHVSAPVVAEIADTKGA
jgi:hypothetical protein